MSVIEGILKGNPDTYLPFAVDAEGNLQTNSLTGLSIPEHDYIALSYTDGNLTGVTYKVGGSTGDTVGQLTLGYDLSGNLTSVTKAI